MNLQRAVGSLLLLASVVAAHAQGSPFQNVYLGAPAVDPAVALEQANPLAAVDSKGDLILAIKNGNSYSVRKVTRSGASPWNHVIVGNGTPTRLYIRPTGEVLVFLSTGTGTRQLELNSYSAAVIRDVTIERVGPTSTANVVLVRSRVDSGGYFGFGEKLEAFSTLTGAPLWERTFLKTQPFEDGFVDVPAAHLMVQTLPNGNISALARYDAEEATAGQVSSVLEYYIIDPLTGANLVENTVGGTGYKLTIQDHGLLANGSHFVDHRRGSSHQEFYRLSPTSQSVAFTWWNIPNGFLMANNRRGFMTGYLYSGPEAGKGVLFEADGGFARLLTTEERAKGLVDSSFGYLNAVTRTQGQNLTYQLLLRKLGVETLADCDQPMAALQTKNGFIVSFKKRINGVWTYGHAKVSSNLTVPPATYANPPGVTNVDRDYFLPTKTVGETWSISSYASHVSVSLRTVLPMPKSDNFSMSKNTILTVAAPGVLSNDFDGEGHPLTAQLRTAPNAALVDSFTFNAYGGFRVVPKPGFTGNIDFYYRVKDAISAEYSEDILVRVKVNP